MHPRSELCRSPPDLGRFPTIRPAKQVRTCVVRRSHKAQGPGPCGFATLGSGRVSTPEGSHTQVRNPLPGSRRRPPPLRTGPDSRGTTHVGPKSCTRLPSTTCHGPDQTREGTLEGRLEGDVTGGSPPTQHTLSPVDFPSPEVTEDHLCSPGGVEGFSALRRVGPGGAPWRRSWRTVRTKRRDIRSPRTSGPCKPTQGFLLVTKDLSFPVRSQPFLHTGSLFVGPGPSLRNKGPVCPFSLRKFCSKGFTLVSFYGLPTLV